MKSTAKDLLTDRSVELFKRENSVDVIRYFFAFSLILAHFCTLCGIDQVWAVSGGTCVNAFFIITGFLVLYSYLRSKNIKDYARKRFRRIVPAYLVCVGFCFALGLIFSDLTLKEFLSNGQSWKYLLCNALFLNFLEPSLPGVFAHNPMTAMDGSLWTMKVEVAFYITLPVLVWLLVRLRKAWVIATLFVLSIIYSEAMGVLYARTANPIFDLLQHQFGGELTFFLGGCTMLLYFDVLHRNLKWVLPLSVALFVVGQFFPRWMGYLEPFTFAVIIVGVAYYCPFLNGLYRKDNISYGLYLYHFPIIQALVCLGVDKYNIWLCFLLAVTLTTAAACASWFWIEGPLLTSPKGGGK